MQEDDYEHYCTYKTQKQKLSNLLLSLLKGRQHWKSLILNLGANDCKENQGNDFQLEQIRKRHIQHFNKHENGKKAPATPERRIVCLHARTENGVTDKQSNC